MMTFIEKQPQILRLRCASLSDCLSCQEFCGLKGSGKGGAIAPRKTQSARFPLSHNPGYDDELSLHCRKHSFWKALLLGFDCVVESKTHFSCFGIETNQQLVSQG